MQGLYAGILSPSMMPIGLLTRNGWPSCSHTSADAPWAPSLDPGGLPCRLDASARFQRSNTNCLKNLFARREQRQL